MLFKSLTFIFILIEFVKRTSDNVKVKKKSFYNFAFIIQ